MKVAKAGKPVCDFFVFGVIYEKTVVLLTGQRNEEAQVKRALSDKQEKAFRLYCRGMKVREIAQKTGISDGTVATYLARARKKLGAKNNAQAALLLLLGLDA